MEYYTGLKHIFLYTHTVCWQSQFPKVENHLSFSVYVVTHYLSISYTHNRPNENHYKQKERRDQHHHFLLEAIEFKLDAGWI